MLTVGCYDKTVRIIDPRSMIGITVFLVPWVSRRQYFYLYLPGLIPVHMHMNYTLKNLGYPLVTTCFLDQKKGAPGILIRYCLLVICVKKMK